MWIINCPNLSPPIIRNPISISKVRYSGILVLLLRASLRVKPSLKCQLENRHTLPTSINYKQHETRNAERKTRNAERGTRNTERGTRNAKRGTRNAEHGTRNAKHGTRNTEHGTRNTEHGTRNIQIFLNFPWYLLPL